MQRLDDYLDQVQHLPPAPRVLLPLLELLGQPDVDSDRVVQLIACDPALTASVMRVSNSAYFAASQPAANLLEAVTRIGFNPVFQMVVTIVGQRTLSSTPTGYGLDEGELWKHSITTALAAKLLARAQGADENEAFTAAILHDLGKIVLAQALERTYLNVLEEIERHQCSFLESEAKWLGAQHAEVGGRLLARWHFPAPLVNAVTYHHQPGQAPAHAPLASYVYLGNMIAYFMGYGYGYAAFALRGRAEALDLVGLEGNDLPRFMIRTLEDLDSLQKLLGINP